MVVAILASVVVPQTSLLTNLPPLDPTNGYYDYVRAAEIWRNHKLTPEPDPEVKPVPSPRAWAEKLAETYAKVLPLLEAGNSKRTWQPRQTVSVATIYSELGYMKQVAKVVGPITFAYFADGQPTMAFRWLRAARLMAYRLPDTDTLTMMVGWSLRLTVDRVLLTHRFEWSASQLQVLLKDMGEAPSVDSFTVSNEADHQILVGVPWEYLKDPISFGDTDKDAPAPLSPSDRGYIERLSRIYFGEHSTITASLFAGPEKNWPANFRAQPPRKPSPEAVTAAFKNGGVPTRFVVPFLRSLSMTEVLSLEGTDEDALTPFLTARVRHRLTQAHLAILLYRRENNKLPDNLRAVNIPPDPLTGTPYVFLPWRGQAYSLACEGTPETGRIEIEAGSQPVKSKVES